MAGKKPFRLDLNSIRAGTFQIDGSIPERYHKVISHLLKIDRLDNILGEIEKKAIGMYNLSAEPVAAFLSQEEDYSEGIAYTDHMKMTPDGKVCPEGYGYDEDVVFEVVSEGPRLPGLSIIYATKDIGDSVDYIERLLGFGNSEIGYISLRLLGMSRKELRDLGVYKQDKETPAGPTLIESKLGDVVTTTEFDRYLRVPGARYPLIFAEFGNRIC